MKNLAKRIPVPNLIIPNILINPSPSEMLYMRLMSIPWMCYGLEDGNYYDNKKVEIAINIADEMFYYP